MNAQEGHGQQERGQKVGLVVSILFWYYLVTFGIIWSLLVGLVGIYTHGSRLKTITTVVNDSCKFSTHIPALNFKLEQLSFVCCDEHDITTFFLESKILNLECFIDC